MFLMYSDTARLSIRTYDPLVKSVTLDLGAPRQDSERPLDLRQNLGLCYPALPFQLFRHLPAAPSPGILNLLGCIARLFQNSVDLRRSWLTRA